MRKTIRPFTLLNSAICTLFDNRIILYPTVILILIQLLALEILYFAPRHPLSNFFGPLISHIWSNDFLHYPMDLILLPKLFYYVQIVIYLFVGNLLLAMTSYLVASIERHHRPQLKHALREAGRSYVHLLCASLISLTLFQAFSTGYTHLVNSILKINTANAMFETIQQILLWSTPYAQFLMGIFVTTLLIYVVPVIILEKKKILSSLRINFGTLFNSFGTTFIIVLIPTLFYLPILAARNNIERLADITLPEIQLFVITLGILITVAIDLLITTTVTMNYLFLKRK